MNLCGVDTEQHKVNAPSHVVIGMCSDVLKRLRHKNEGKNKPTPQRMCTHTESVCARGSSGDVVGGGGTIAYRAR